MKKDINITNAELPIMKELWKNGTMTSPEIIQKIDGNKSTIKTLLKRLVEKEAVGITEINSRNYNYSALISEKDYINWERKGFIRRVFDGSKKKMLLNFVKEEKITREDLEQLLQMIEEEQE